MHDSDKLVLVYTTFPSAAAADAAGVRLVELRLAACVNVIPAMTSIYRWEGQIERGAEVVGSELVGLMPAGAAVAAAGASLRIDGFDASHVLELRLLDS